MTHIKLANIVRINVGAELFTDRSYDAKRNAQLNLQGRTHYVDADTLRFFHARVISAFDSCDGLVFFVVESSAKNSGNTERGFRPVLFDVFGTVINPRNVYYVSSDKAKKAGYEFLNAFDLMAHYRAAIADKATEAKAEHDALREAYNATFEE